MSADQNSYNKGGMVTFIASMAASMGVLIYVIVFGVIDLKEVKPEAAGAAQTQAQAGGAVPQGAVDVSGIQDPWMPSEPMIARGTQLYQQQCAMCHGPAGKGDGPAGQALNPKPRNLVEGKWKKGGTRVGLMEVMNNGLPPSSMQGYKHLPLNDRWALVHYVRSITENLAKDDDAEVAKQAAALK
jgi:mono/diheme cytochrome c family protein